MSNANNRPENHEQDMEEFWERVSAQHARQLSDPVYAEDLFEDSCPDKKHLRPMAAFICALAASALAFAGCALYQTEASMPLAVLAVLLLCGALGCYAVIAAQRSRVSNKHVGRRAAWMTLSLVLFALALSAVGVAFTGNVPFLLAAGAFGIVAMATWGYGFSQVVAKKIG